MIQPIINTCIFEYQNKQICQILTQIFTLQILLIQEK